MKILSVRHGFASDHSSTSYEFLAVDKPLSKKERSEVSKLSSRADPSARRVDFSYHMDGYDIPGGWLKLMEKYYDVMYRESYDWWTLAMAFDGKPGQYEELIAYEFSGADDFGVEVTKEDDRIVVVINCRIDIGITDTDYDDYNDFGDEDGDEEDDDDSDGEGDGDGDGNIKNDARAGGRTKERVIVETDDALLNLLENVRMQIIGGDYRTLYAVWERYGDADDYEEDEILPPKPKTIKSGESIVNAFANILDDN